MARRSKVLPRMLIPCLALVLILGGCSGSGGRVETDKIGITEFYRNLETAQMQVGISADFPERVAKYRVAYAYSKSGTSAMTILEPKSVSDVKITIAQGATELSFDGTRLETGTIDETGTTPLSALPCLIKAWAQGDVSETEAVKRDGTEALLLIYRNTSGEQQIEYRSWFDRQSYNPIYAEVLVDGRCKVRCEFETMTR